MPSLLCVGGNEMALLTPVEAMLFRPSGTGASSFRRLFWRFVEGAVLGEGEYDGSDEEEG